jgi:adenosine deaminase CECR1
VGEESKGRPLRDFIPQLLAFREECLHPRKKNSKKAPSKDSDRYLDVPVDIPFLFHCGETLEMGDETPDGNLYDALLLGAKRIGHGYALARHPYVMEQMKRANVCIELCPISNEILGLTPRVNGHAMYNLLANNVHCTVNTDNGTLFK